jgi:exosortase
LLTPRDDAHERRILGVLVVLLVLAFWPTLSTFYATWARSYQEQGFFIAGLTAWLFWRYRDRVRRWPGEGTPALVPVAGALSLGWMLAVIMNVAVVHQLLLVLTLTAWAVATFGPRARVPILSTAATFLIAVPFWNVINPVLRRATTLMSGAIARAGGVSAVIRDDTITIASGTFLVEAGCSGINYFMAGLTLGAFYAHFFTDRWQTQLKIVAVAGAASMVGNWIRVAVLVLMGEATQMQSPLIYDHLWQGWAIFTLLMIPTYFLIRRIERHDAKAAGRPDAPGAGTFDASRPRRAATAGAFAIIGPVLYVGLGVVPKIGALDRSPDVLGVSERWTVTERAAGDIGWRPAYQAIDEQVQWTVTLPGESVDAGRYYFVNQRQGEEMIGYGNAIAPDSLLVSDRLIGPVGPRRRYVREAIFFDSDSPRVAWYWYRVAGIDTPTASRAKLLEVLAYALRKPASELITLSARCAPDDCASAARALRMAMEGNADD